MVIPHEPPLLDPGPVPLEIVIKPTHATKDEAIAWMNTTCKTSESSLKSDNGLTDSSLKIEIDIHQNNWSDKNLSNLSYDYKPINQFHHRWQLNNSASSAANCTSLPPHQVSLYSIEQNKTHAIMREFGLDKIDSSFNAKLLFDLLVKYEFPNIPFAAGIIAGFANGFSSNVPDPSGISRMNKNHVIPPHLTNVVQRYHQDEMELKRHSVVTQELLNELPYKNSNPLSVAEGKKKCRVITDMLSSGINSRMDNSTFGKMILDRIPTLLEDINKYPLSSDLVIGTEDVKAYYRHFPCRVVDQTLQLYKINNVIAIDHYQCFGSCSAPFICTHFLDLVCWLFEAKFKLIVRHYIDNIYWVVPATQGVCSQKIVQLLLESLGVPTNPHDIQLSNEVRLLGFQINTTSRTISVPAEAKSDILSILDKLIAGKKSSLKNFQKATGKLLWCCQAIPGGMGKASRLWSKCTTAVKSNTKDFSLEDEIIRTLKWFQSTLQQWCGTTFISPSSAIRINDASGSASDASHIGGAFLSHTHYGFYVWCTKCVEEAQGNMTLLELAAILVGLSNHIGSLGRSSILIWLTDNEGAHKLLRKGYSSCTATAKMIELIDEIRKAEIVYQLGIAIEWVSRKNISRVDSLTRGSDTDFLKDRANASLKKVEISLPLPLRMINRNTNPMVCLFGKHE